MNKRFAQPENYLSTMQLCERFNVSRTTVYKYCDRLQHVLIGRERYFPEAEAVAVMRNAPRKRSTIRTDAKRA